MSMCPCGLACSVSRGAALRDFRGNGRRQRRDIEARARFHADVRVVEELFPSMPGVELDELVGAHQQRDRRLRAFALAPVRQRVDGIGVALAIDFIGADGDAHAVERERCGRRARHRQPMLRRRDARFCHGCPAGNSTSSVSRSSSTKRRASARCPLWIGSKVPPKMPTRFVQGAAGFKAIRAAPESPTEPRLGRARRGVQS